MRSPQLLLKSLACLMVVAGAFCAGKMWQERQDRQLIQEFEWREGELGNMLANTPFIIPEAKARKQFVPLSELVIDGEGAVD